MMIFSLTLFTEAKCSLADVFCKGHMLDILDAANHVHLGWVFVFVSLLLKNIKAIFSSTAIGKQARVRFANPLMIGNWNCISVGLRSCCFLFEWNKCDLQRFYFSWELVLLQKMFHHCSHAFYSFSLIFKCIININAICNCYLWIQNHRSPAGLAVCVGEPMGRPCWATMCPQTLKIHLEHILIIMYFCLPFKIGCVVNFLTFSPNLPVHRHLIKAPIEIQRRYLHSYFISYE